MKLTYHPAWKRSPCSRRHHCMIVWPHIGVIVIVVPVTFACGQCMAKAKAMAMTMTKSEWMPMALKTLMAVVTVTVILSMTIMVTIYITVDFSRPTQVHWIIIIYCRFSHVAIYTLMLLKATCTGYKVLCQSIGHLYRAGCHCVRSVCSWCGDDTYWIQRNEWGFYCLMSVAYVLYQRVLPLKGRTHRVPILALNHIKVKSRSHSEITKGQSNNNNVK